MERIDPDIPALPGVAVPDASAAIRGGGGRPRRALVAACAVSLLLCAGDGRAGVATVVGSLPSPLPAPRFDLAFDSTTETLWGIENATASSNVMNFTLAGTFVSGFLTEPYWNSVGIAVNQLAGASKRIYYWKNLTRKVYEVDANGTLLDATELPFGHQVLIDAIGFDPGTGRVVAPHGALESQAIEAGFSHVEPGVGIESTELFDFARRVGMTLFLGFEVSAESYWILGPTSFVDEIVQIDRATLTVVDRFVLPGSSGQTYRGLARDPETGIFYSNFEDEGIRALTLPEPGAEAGAVALAVLVLRARGPRRSPKVSASAERASPSAAPRER